MGARTYLFALAAAASGAHASEAALQCAAEGDGLLSGPSSCRTALDGDESELLQSRVSSSARRHTTAGNTTRGGFNQLKAQVFASLSKLTYCNAAFGTALSVESTCGAKGFCKKAGVRAKQGSVRTISMADGGIKNSLVAYVARLVKVGDVEDPLKPACVIAVRGTYPGTNNDARNKQSTLVPIEFGACDGCKVYEGHQEMWKQLMPAVMNSLKSISCEHKGPLYLTGHSMGGSVAAIGMYALASMGWDVQPSYTFHSPKTFNPAGVKELSKLVTGSVDGIALTRVTHAKDFVPVAPISGDFAFSWPEAHYFDKDESKSKEKGHKHMYEVCFGSKSCGLLKYDKLCKQSDCDDHLVNPLAPDGNIAMFKSWSSTCDWGQGTVKATSQDDLPKAKAPSQEQLDWLYSYWAQNPKHEAKCIDDWQPSSGCVSEFEYTDFYGKKSTVSGCTHKDSVLLAIMGAPWCSMETPYKKKWSPCTPCGDAAQSEWDAWMKKDSSGKNAYAAKEGKSNSMWR